MSFIPAEIIKKKRNGQANTDSEIQFLIAEFSAGRLPDYQLAAWAMSVYFQGMNSQEIATLTAAMKNSGKTMDFSHLSRPRIDKHSTGGVGDKTSLILGPIVVEAGIAVPMIAGRGLGHTGGTLDKLESIPGFRVELTHEEFVHNLESYHFSLMGQTPDICPADRKFYALRDVTATVESRALICGSIMSKKLCEDLNGLVLDVKFGSGAFMKNLEDAEDLAQLLKDTGEHQGVRVSALLTNMNQPLGRYIGNSLEVQECLEIMRGQSFEVEGVDFYEDTRELTLQLAGHMIWLANKASSLQEGYDQAKSILESGKALRNFQELCRFQGPAKIDALPQAKFKRVIKSSQSGYLSFMNTERIGLSSLQLGAGRQKKSDVIDPSAGIEMNCRLGQKITSGQTLAILYGNEEKLFDSSTKTFLEALEYSESPIAQQPLIANVIC